MEAKRREPSCVINHDVQRRYLRDRQLEPRPCPECGWVLSAMQERPTRFEPRFAEPDFEPE